MFLLQCVGLNSATAFSGDTILQAVLQRVILLYHIDLYQKQYFILNAFFLLMHLITAVIILLPNNVSGRDTEQPSLLFFFLTKWLGELNTHS